MDRERPILVPHSRHGDPECPGIVMAVSRGDVSDLTCNECGAVIATVASAEAVPTLLRMALGNGVTSERCTTCGEVNVFVGWSVMEAFVCRWCGAGVVVERRVE